MEIEDLAQLQNYYETLDVVDKLKSKRFWMTILFTVVLGVIAQAGWIDGSLFAWLSTTVVVTYLIAETIRPSGMV